MGTVTSNSATRREVRSVCQYCSALCGVVVGLEGETVVSVKGDKLNRRSRGYICPKGASLPSFHHRADRLTEPRFKHGETEWTSGLDDLAERLKAVAEAHGPDAIAAFNGNGTVADGVLLRLGLVARFVAAIGSSQLYSAASIDSMPSIRSTELVAGSLEVFPLWRDEEPESKLVIFWGVNPFNSHGYYTMFPNPVDRVAAFQKRGGRAWVVDPRTTKLGAMADGHLAIRPGADAALLAWLVRELLIDGADQDYLEQTTSPEDVETLRAAVEPFTREVAATATDLPAAQLDELLSEIRAAGRLAVIIGTGINFSRHALVANWLRWALLIVTGSLDQPGGMSFSPGWLEPLEARETWNHAPPEGRVGAGTRSRPELPRLIGQNSAVALIDEIEAGHIRALVVVGANPLLGFPDPGRVARAFKSLDTLVVLDVVETTLTQMATDVLPCTGALERSDILVETFSTLFAPALVAPVGERKPAWWVLSQLARRLGADLLDGRDPDTLSEDAFLLDLAKGGRTGAESLVAAGGDGIAAPPLHGWVRDRALPAGRWRLAPPGLAEQLPDIRDDLLGRARSAEALLLAAGRQLTRVNATLYVPERKASDFPQLRMHPLDAEARQLRTGDPVVMRSDYGEVSAVLLPDEIVRPGVVWMPHGWPDTNVGALTSTKQRIDPLTGQPEMTGIVVTVTADRRASAP